MRSESLILTFPGPIVVHDPADPYAGQYDEELVLTTSDWYHDTIPVLLSQLLSPSNTNFLPPFPDALLINDSQNVTFKFTAGKTYKINIISMAALASTLIQFDSHTMRVIGVDGSYIQEHDAYQIRLAPAQRYTVLLNAQPTTRRNYAFLASLDENRDYLNDAAPVWPYNVTGYIVYDDTKPLPAPYVVNKWSIVNDFTFVALDNQALLGDPDVSVTLDFAFCLDSGGIPRYLLTPSHSLQTCDLRIYIQSMLQQHLLRLAKSALVIHSHQHRDLKQQSLNLRPSKPVHRLSRFHCPNHSQQPRRRNPSLPSARPPIPSLRAAVFEFGEF